MPLAVSLPKIKFARSDSEDFSTIEEAEFNIRAIALSVQNEELFRALSGERISKLDWELEIEFEPFSTIPQTSAPDTGDKIRLISMVSRPYLKILSVSGLPRYSSSGGIPDAVGLISGKRVSFSSVSTSLDSQKARETLSCTFTLIQT